MTTVPIIARVPADLAEAFALLAKSRGNDLSTELRTAMRERVERALTNDEPEAGDPRARPNEAYDGGQRVRAT